MPAWCSQQIVVTVEGPGGRFVVTLEQPFAIVGSHSRADVLIPGPNIAQRTYYLHATPDGIYCLYLDVPASRPEEKGRWLAPDERLAIGEYVLQVRASTAADGVDRNTADLATLGSASPPLPVLLVYCGDLLKDKRRFRSRLSLVGRRPQCGLQLKGMRVSSFHCVLYWDGQQLWCIDLKSSNGTTLGGQPIQCAAIGIGDRIEVGEFGLLFQRLSKSGGQTKSRSSRPPDRAPAGPPELVQQAPTGARTGSETERPADAREVDQWRELLAAEVARMGRERETMQARWDAASQQLAEQVAALQDEAARLAREREALSGARNRFLDEQASQNQQLNDRATELASLEAKLTLTAAALSDRLEQASRLAESSAKQPLPEPAADDLLSASLVPATIVDISPPLPGETVVPPAHVQQVIADTQWETALALATQVELSVAGTGSQGDLQPHFIEGTQARRDESSERLQAQIDKLQDELKELASQRLALDQSRQDWQAERLALAEQLTGRAEQLALLESDLAAATARLAQHLDHANSGQAVARQRPGPVPAESVAEFAAVAEIDDDKIAPAQLDAGLEQPDVHIDSIGADDAQYDDFSETLSLPTGSAPDFPVKEADEIDSAILTSTSAAAPIEQANSTSPVLMPPGTEAVPLTSVRRRDATADDTQQLAMLVSARVGEKYAAQSMRWLWWSAGGLAVVVLLATIVVGVIWSR